MPFTLAHPGAVLPIHSRWKRWFALAPLVVGSMVPDAAYYLPLSDSFKANAHSWLGAFTFSIPIGLGILLILYWLDPELIFLLPDPHREALKRSFKTPKLSLWFVVMAVSGIVVGAESHVAWDSFTHKEGWLQAAVPREIAGMNPYFVLQVLSSLIGLWLVLRVYDRWTRSLGFRAWTVRWPTWRSVLWLAIVLGCLTEALIESRVIQAVITLNVIQNRHPLLILTTSSIRDFVFAACLVAVCVKLSGRAVRQVAC